MPFDPDDYDPSFYDTGGASLLVGGTGMSAARTASVWALQLELASGFPVSYPRTFDAAPLRISSLDLQPATALGSPLADVLFEARLLEAPVVTSSALDEFGGVRDGETLSFRCTAAPPHGGTNLHSWVALEHRGKPIDGWLLDLDPTTLDTTAATKVFRGEVLAMSDDPATVSLLVRVFDVFALTQPVPTIRVDTSWAPYAPAAGLGQVVPHGVGIGRRVRCHCVKARSFDDTLVSVTATASAATDVLTVAAGYDWVTGDGPLRVVSSGTLPAPLKVDTDYFAIAVDNDTQLRLATTRGNAIAGANIDLTSAGSGTLTVSSGIAPNLDDHTDFVVGVGNVAVCQVWLDGETEVPEWPFDYAVLNQVYQVDGVYLTVIRFPGDFAEAVVEADVLRVDPDADGSVTLDLKFCRGFQDDALGWNIGLAGTDTSTLVEGAHRFRLGAWAPPTTTGQLQLPPQACRMPTRSVRLVWTAPKGASAGSDAVLWWDGALVLIWRAASQRLEMTIKWLRQAGDPGAGEVLQSSFGELSTDWTGVTGTNSVPVGSTNHILMRVDSGTGKVSLMLNGLPDVVSQTKPGARQLQSVIQPFIGGITGRLERAQVRGSLISDGVETRAIWRWRRNGVDWLRELFETGRVPVDPLYADLAAANWHQVESGQLTVDGWLTGETELRAAVLAVAIMRALSFTFTPAGVRIDSPYTSPSNTATLGHGDAYGNLTALPTRTRASMTEAPTELQVRYRRTRAAGTDTVEFGQAITRPVYPAGARPLTLELPFVDTGVAADIVSDWVTKRLIARDTLIRLDAGIDARDVQIGHVVTLSIPQMGISLPQAEVIGRERGAQRQSLSVVPFAGAAFTYDPKPLPPDPVEPFFEPVSFGSDPTLSVTTDSALAKTVRVEVLPRSWILGQRPISDTGVFQQASQPPCIVSRMSGALPPASLAAEVDDPGAHDGDATAIRLQRSVIDGASTIVNVLFEFPSVDPLLPITDVSVAAIGRAGAVNEILDTVGQSCIPDLRYASGAITLLGGIATYRNASQLLIRTDGQAWTGALLNATDFGCRGTVTQNLYVTRVQRDIGYRVPITQPVRVKYYRLITPTGTVPFPDETAAPTWEADDIAPQIDIPGATTPAVISYFARVYDGVGRLIVALGPAQIGL